MRIAFLSRIQRNFSFTTLSQEPLGGTQAALLHLAHELAKRGHEVHIFCQAGTQVSEGVFFHPIPQLARFARQNPIDFLISVADELALKLGIPARYTLAWLHNDYPHLWTEMPDIRAESSRIFATCCDRVIVTSDWQAQKLGSVFQLPHEHLAVLPNGIQSDYFLNAPEPAQPPRILYTSVPNRGLELLLKLFPDLKAEQPELELHIYSSFKIWGLSDQKDQAAGGAIYALAKSIPGVFLHAAVPPAQLGKILSEGTLWTYPQKASQPLPGSGGLWVEAETFCLAALEAQAAGLPVVASARGALSETVRHGETGLLIEGEPGSEAFNRAFKEAVIALLNDPQRRLQMGLTARTRALTEFNWSTVAQQWEALFQDFESTRLAQAPLNTDFLSPEISVIIPTYNRARNLKNCLESLTWQDFKAFEVIVCDDGSSDSSREISESFQERLNLRYRWQEDLGFRAAEARNMGLQLARGKLIVFLDSDLVIPSLFLTAHAQAHKSHPHTVVNSYVYRMQESIDEDLGLPPEQYIPLHQEILKPDSRDRYQLFERGTPIEETYFLDSNALSMTRSDLDRVGGFDADFIGWGHEDTELGYRVAAHGMQLWMVKEGAIAYHQYHYVSEEKEAEQVVNWKRLADKHGIKSWYHPLWELPIQGSVQLDSDTTPEHLFLPPIMEAEWTLKTGHALPQANLHYRLKVKEGVLTAIVPFYTRP